MSTSGAAGWGAYFVRLIITSIVAAGILFGVAIFAMNRYMTTVHTSANRLSANVEALSATVSRVDSDLTASIERLNNNVSRIEREITSLQGKSGRLAAEISQIQSGITETQPKPEEAEATSAEPAQEATAEAAEEPAAATEPVPGTAQTLPIPTSKPEQ